MLIPEAYLTMRPEPKETGGGKSFLKMNMSFSLYCKGEGDVRDGKKTDYRTVYVNGACFGRQIENDNVLSLDKGDYIYSVEFDLNKIGTAKNGNPTFDGYINEFKVPRARKIYNGNGNGNGNSDEHRVPENTCITEQSAQQSAPAYKKVSAMQDDVDDVG